MAEPLDIAVLGARFDVTHPGDRDCGSVYGPSSEANHKIQTSVVATSK